jgi:hypothetical protein
MWPISGYDFEPRPTGDPYSRRNRSVVGKSYRSSKYQPHQGDRESARRRRQMHNGTHGL